MAETGFQNSLVLENVGSARAERPSDAEGARRASRVKRGASKPSEAKVSAERSAANPSLTYARVFTAA
jgi:hypothetical protein